MTAELPAGLAARPFDEQRGLPVPYVNETDEGVVDFTGVNGPRAAECGRGRLCGLCHEPMDYWVAFIGGPASMNVRTFTDPPMHPECAEAAIRLCPHIAIARHKRAPKHRLAPGVVTPPGFHEDKPAEYCIGITRHYKMALRDGFLIFLPSPWKTVRRFPMED